MAKPAFSEDQLTEKLIGCIIKVHQKLGPGFIEGIYRNAIVIECGLQGIRAEYEKEISIYYEGHFVGKHKLDLLIEDHLILELKQVDELGRTQYAQVRSYLKATGLKRALLVNFAKSKADIRRVEIN